MSGAFTIIAEAGVNHNGSLARALELVDVAADAGADVVKFQTFNAEALATAKAPKAAYQHRTTKKDESQLAMLRALELSLGDHKKLMARANEKGIAFLSTPFDLESLVVLDQKLDLPCLKMGSGEMTNAPLLFAAAQTGKPIILSTGMARLPEIEVSLGVLALGYQKSNKDLMPSRADFVDAFHSADGRRALKDKVTLLHCTSAYPTPDTDINLSAIATLKDQFGLDVGFSDHSQGIEISIASPAAGAVMVEKHFTLDRTLPGPDHEASIEPDELAAMVRGIRRVVAALGDGEKTPRESELGNINVARKSLVAACPIAKGAVFTAENLTVKRPGGGLDPIDYWAALGKPAPRAFASDDLIVLEN